MTLSRSIFIVLMVLVASLTGGHAQPKDGNPQGDYVLQPQDLLRVIIFKEDNLARDVRITKEYAVQLPLIGSVDLRGKTLRQAEDLVRELYERDYLIDPQVNLTVVEYSSRTVNVLGAVNSPGVVVFPQEQGLTLIDAISRAGAFSRLADRRKIKLTRTLADGRTENYVINADNLIEGSSNQAWFLQPNDVIYVPERIL